MSTVPSLSSSGSPGITGTDCNGGKIPSALLISSFQQTNTPLLEVLLIFVSEIKMSMAACGAGLLQLVFAISEQEGTKFIWMEQVEACEVGLGTVQRSRGQLLSHAD